MENKSQEQAVDPDVDNMILDYLLCMAIRAVINERVIQRTEGHSHKDAEHLLNIVDVFFSLFKINHPDQKLTDDIALKFQVLTFANLFLRRYRDSVYLPSRKTLQKRRITNRKRAKLWVERNKAVMSQGRNNLYTFGNGFSLDKNYKDMREHMGLPPDNSMDWNSRVSLLDILPEYMALGDVIPSVLRQTWMENAILLMLQCALEQVLVYGETEAEKIDEAFAWDWPYSHNWLGNGTEKAAWTTSRDVMRCSLIPSGTSTSEVNLKRLSFKYPLFEVEGAILDSLNDLLNMLEIPILQRLGLGTASELNVMDVTGE
ncbi:hypothetical protein DIZ76_010591 [Coccidioides immitis]|nr:conserved hypothetical protein [Coccidioides posadasii str. Silveira]TPX25142.1 hypothetical protein DIZ76_010591 [Coccidioides immitis]